MPPKLFEPTKEERQSHEATHWFFRAWCEICVKAKSPDGKHTGQLGSLEHIPVIEFDFAFAADALGDPSRRISMIFATDSIHGSFFCCCGKEKRWPGRFCDAEFPKLYRSVWFWSRQS